MANVSQKISSYVHGISQQPDHLKRAGQVRDILNGLPDVTEGLIKRPGSDLITQLDTEEGGKWFTIFRDKDEKYICQILRGRLRIWSLIDGVEKVVRFNKTPDLENPSDGGSAIKPPFDSDVEITGKPTGDGSTIPGSCNLAALNRAAESFRVATNRATEAKNEYQEAVKTADYYKANRQKDVIVSRAKQTGWWMNNTGIWLDRTKPQTPPKGYKLGELRFTQKVKLITYNVYDKVQTQGKYTDSQVDAKVAAADIAEAKYRLAEQTKDIKRQEYEDEKIKCRITTFINAESPWIPYLQKAGAKDIDILTLNDYTFILNKEKRVSMGKSRANVRPYEAFVELKSLEPNSEYNLQIISPNATQNVVKTRATSLAISPSEWTDEDANSIHQEVEEFTKNIGNKINLVYTIENRGSVIPDGKDDYDASYTTYVTLVNGGEGWVKGDSWTQTMKGKEYTIRVSGMETYRDFHELVKTSPKYIGKDDTIKSSTILDHFEAEIRKHSGWTAKVIGNGLYIKGPKPFSVEVNGGKTGDSFRGFTNKVNDISKLPVQCRDGYLVKILNTGEHDDDYYVRFIGTTRGVDGPGAWEETIAPGITKNLNYNTMPHQIVRMPDGTFMVSPVDWEERLVGDTKTNPKPSFVDRTISKMFFYRNRFGFLSDENVILSRAGDFFNFFVKTALTISDSDPIDLATSSTSPCVLHDAVPVNPGLILFSRDKQFILTTSQDQLTPVAAKLDVLSTYNCSESLPAFEMGTTVGFLAQAGKYSRMWEMTGISQQGTPEVLEQSKLVQELLPNTINEVANAKDNTLILFGIRGSTDLIVYRYFNDGEKRIQSAWFRWSAPGNLVHHAVDDDTYYGVYDRGGQIYLARTNIVPMSSENIVTSDPSYSPRLDLKTVISKKFITYDAATNTSSFLSPIYYNTDAYVFGLGYGQFQGRGAEVLSISQIGDKWKVTIPGNWSDNFIVIGYRYTMKVTVPHYYYSATSGDSVKTDTRMYTNIHRVKFEFGKVGLFDITVNKVGKDNFHSIYEQSPADDYDADTHEVKPTAIHTVPVYEKNLNFYIDLKSTYPTPCTLLSSVWEGTVSPKSYKSV